MRDDLVSDFISTLKGVIGDKDLSFFLQIVDSGIKEDVPYIKLLNGDMLFGRRERVNDLYTDVFDKYEELLVEAGLIEECFGTAYDSLTFYHYENCSNGLIKKTDLIGKGAVLDIGSRSGHFAVKASRHLGAEGKIVCVDATDDAEQSLELHRKYNSLTNVEFVKCLVGDQNGKECNFYSGSDNETYSGIFPETHLLDGNVCIEKDYNTKCSVMQMKTIDALVNERKLDDVSFISLQINGAEPVALRGARETLKEFKPNIYSTAFMLTDDGRDPQLEILDGLMSLGYKCLIKGGEELVLVHSSKAGA